MKTVATIVGVLIGIIGLVWWELRPTGMGIGDLVAHPSEVLGTLLGFWGSEIRGFALLLAVGVVWWLVWKARDRWRAHKGR